VLLVVQLNAMGQAVAVKADTSISTSSSPGPTPGTLQVCASFDSPAAATAFDVQLNPTFLVSPIGTGQITGTLTFTPAMQLQAQEFEHGDDEFRGNGETEGGGRFEEGAHRHQDGSSEGRTHYKNDQEHCSFKSTQITLIQITPTGIDPTTGRQLGVLHMEGQGLNYGQPVTFVLDSVDNGDSGMLSTYSLATSDGCHGGGHVTKGHPTYHHDD